MRSYFFLISLFSHFYSFSQGVWVQKTSPPYQTRVKAVAFSIGNKGYIGLGSSMTIDFWEYNPVSDSWAQKANFPAGPRNEAVGLAIGNKGYVGTGYDNGGPAVVYNDFWEYDPVSNNWTQKANFGGAPRIRAAAFSIFGKGYIGTGGNNIYYDDFWEYDPVNNIWIQKANFIGVRLDIDRATFVIGNKGYWGTGAWASATYNDFWEYDPGSNSWTQKANFPSTPRIGATGFSICDKGYLGLGYNGSFPGLADYWMYDPSNNSWSAIAPIPTGGEYDLPSFVINSKAYIVSQSGTFWEYTIDNVVNSVAIVTATISTICVGDSVILSASGGNYYLWNTGATANSIVVFPTSTNTYSVTVFGSCNEDIASVTINVINSANASFTYGYDPCKNNCVQFADASVNAFSWCWDMGDGGNSSNQNPCWQYPVTTTYNPSLVVNCNTACADTFSVFIPYEIHDTASVLYIPNAFSPNGDGENDVLHFYIQDDYCVKEFEITIYDRWGEKVYETTNLSDSWDGSFNGKKLHSDMFVYYCKTISATGIITTRKGNINLLW